MHRQVEETPWYLWTRIRWQLGHGGQEHEFVPRLVGALVGKKLVGAAADGFQTAVWTFGRMLGHGGAVAQPVPH